jgi:hypothetical protein
MALAGDSDAEPFHVIEERGREAGSMLGVVPRGPAEVHLGSVFRGHVENVGASRSPVDVQHEQRRRQVRAGHGQRLLS